MLRPPQLTPPHPPLASDPPRPTHPLGVAEPAAPTADVIVCPSGRIRTLNSASVVLRVVCSPEQHTLKPERRKASIKAARVTGVADENASDSADLAAVSVKSTHGLGGTGLGHVSADLSDLSGDEVHEADCSRPNRRHHGGGSKGLMVRRPGAQRRLPTTSPRSPAHQPDPPQSLPARRSTPLFRTDRGSTFHRTTRQQPECLLRSRAWLRQVGENRPTRTPNASGGAAAVGFRPAMATCCQGEITVTFE